MIKERELYKQNYCNDDDNREFYNRMHYDSNFELEREYEKLLELEYEKAIDVNFIDDDE